MTTYRFDGDCVLDGSDSIVYDDLSPRAGEIIVELLNYRALLEAADDRNRALLEPLQEIARLTNIYLAGGCREKHFDEIPSKLYAELLKFEDDSFSTLKEPPASPATHEGDVTP